MYIMNQQAIIGLLATNPEAAIHLLEHYSLVGEGHQAQPIKVLAKQNTRNYSKNYSPAKSHPSITPPMPHQRVAGGVGWGE